MARKGLGIWATAFLAGILGAASWRVVAPAPAGAQGPGIAGQVKATQFVLVDAKGETVAVLGAFDWQAARGAQGAEARPRPAVGLVVYDGPRAAVQLGRMASAASLDLRAPDGRTALGVSADGAGMGLWAPEQTLRFGLGMQGKGNGGFVINDLKGRERMGVGMPPDHGVSMSLKDEEGNAVWNAP